MLDTRWRMNIYLVELTASLIFKYILFLLGAHRSTKKKLVIRYCIMNIFFQPDSPLDETIKFVTIVGSEMCFISQLCWYGEMVSEEVTI